jgi:hypothetical protein
MDKIKSHADFNDILAAKLCGISSTENLFTLQCEQSKCIGYQMTENCRVVTHARKRI